MAKLTRVTGKVFGSAATATIKGIGQFGSAATGTPNLTTDVATIQALQAYLDGWGSAVITSRNFPPIEEVTGVLKTISYQACYTLQEGIPEYDINTEYSNTSIVKSVNNGVITLYASLTNSNIGNSLTDTDYWKPYVLDKLDIDGTNATTGLFENAVSVAQASGKNTVISWGMPDYSTGITTGSVKGSGNAYTIPYNCFCIVQDSENTETVHTINVNGNVVPCWNNVSIESLQLPYASFYLSQGDVVYTNTSATLKIYKLKGEV